MDGLGGGAKRRPPAAGLRLGGDGGADGARTVSESNGVVAWSKYLLD